MLPKCEKIVLNITKQSVFWDHIFVYLPSVDSVINHITLWITGFRFYIVFYPGGGVGTLSTLAVLWRCWLQGSFFYPGSLYQESVFHMSSLEHVSTLYSSSQNKGNIPPDYNRLNCVTLSPQPEPVWMWNICLQLPRCNHCFLFLMILYSPQDNVLSLEKFYKLP